MRDIIWIKDIKKEDVPVAGGKGANLGEMYQAGFNVPNGFVITAQIFKKFIKEAKIKKKIFEILNSIDIENTAELDEKTEQIRKIIINTELPDLLAVRIVKAYEDVDKNEELEKFRMKELPFVAVRSSATTEDLEDASFAGQQETFLNVKGKDQLLESVKKCWASLFTARAVYYRAKKGFDHNKALIAVVVQKFILSEKAGVVFTVNPLTNNKDEIVAEAVFGMGQGIVSGSIEPDHYVIDKKTGRVKEKRIGLKKFAFTRSSGGQTIKKPLTDAYKDKQVMYDHEIRKLWEQVVKVEDHYNFPQDIEFVIASGDVYIVQTRAITTLKKEKKKESLDITSTPILSGLPASPGFALGSVKIIHDIKELAKIQVGDVLVTKMTNPDMVVSMQKANAIVTDEGGATCHAAIVSRELGIPCVVGTKNATEVLKENQEITVDGTNGKVYDGKLEIQSPEKHEHRKHRDSKIKVKCICDLPAVAERAKDYDLDGVGLIRVEFMIAESGIHPVKYLQDGNLQDYTNMLANGIGKIADHFKGKPIWVRTSDIRTDEYKSLKGASSEPREDNPMLGWHGIRRSLEQSKILRAEFKAIKQLHKQGYNNVGVMIPFLINVDELTRSKQIMREVGLEPVKDVDFGVMIETPASCMIIDELCKEGISFISFGTNDLTQTVLGIDRNNEHIAHLYSEMHPAVLRLMEKVIQSCKKYGVKTSICGQAGSSLEMARFLVKEGIDSISVNLDAVDKIRGLF
ncbi:MAG: phosphoenolpyruvate synthase [archaeon]|nr:MAG: phosphoenolpyruvate synthase [archaeon]